MKKPFIPLLAAGSMLLLVLVACSTPDFRTFTDPVMSTDVMQAEMERLHTLNLTVADGEFDPSVYPISVGVDMRNGKMLVEKFVCWDACPDVGMVFLLYENVKTKKACQEAVVGTPLMAPETVSGDYWGCRPVVDWLDTPRDFSQ